MISCCRGILVTFPFPLTRDPIPSNTIFHQDVADKERAGLVEYYGNVWEEAVTELNQQLQRLLHERLTNRTSRMDQIIQLKLHGAADHAAVKDKLDSDIEKVRAKVQIVKLTKKKNLLGYISPFKLWTMKKCFITSLND